MTIHGPLNVASELPVNASETYARNVLDFVRLLITDGELAPHWDDEILAGSVLTRDGAVVHEPTRALARRGGRTQRERLDGIGRCGVSGWTALYLFMLAGFTGYVVIGAVPVILHTPLMSGANFVHGIVLVGAMVSLGFARTPLEITIGVVAVVFGAMNVHGGFVVTVRMLAMFKSSRDGGAREAPAADAAARRQRPRRRRPRRLHRDSSTMTYDDLIKASYFATAVLVIIGLRSMSSPKTARRGIIWAGAGMSVAAAATFFTPGMHNHLLMLGAVAAGVGVAQWSGQRVPMTGMPQMIALFNGMGGGAAAAIAAVELLKGGAAAAARRPADVAVFAVAGALIGAVSFGGSLVAFAKLQGLVKRVLSFPGQNVANLLVLAAAVAAGVFVVLGETGTVAHVGGPLVAGFVGISFVFGILMTLPIGGADMPVVISLYNALTGLAVAFEGYVLGNTAMIIAGMVVGAAGTMLTRLMAKAMNRSLGNVLFSGFGSVQHAGAAMAVEGGLKPIEAADAAIMMAYARKVVIAPGYGMAVAQAQHKVWELAQLLLDRGVRVEFAIHPVAGRMPGHMNVLLAEAGVPYDYIRDLDEVNPEFATVDVALVIGANDTVNLSARLDAASPIYGMPILDVDKASNVIVVKRGAGTGFAGVENPLFFADNVRMLYGDGQAVAADLIRDIKNL